MLPLSGVASIYGQEILRAVSLAVAQVNAAGGVAGRSLELLAQDDGSQPATAVAAALTLIDVQGCRALIGPLLSNARHAVVGEVMAMRGLPMLNFSCQEGSIREHGFFSFAALPNQQIEPLMRELVQRFGPKVFFAGSNYEWPRGSIEAARRALALHGGESVGEQYLPLGLTARELPALMEALRYSGADVFVPFFAGRDQIQVLQAFAHAGLKARMAVVSCQFDEVMASQLKPEEREGVYSCNTYFMSLSNPENQDMLAQLRQWPGVSGLWPHGDGLISNFGAGAYLCVMALAQAAAACQSWETTNLIAALKQVDLLAPQGRVRMDPASQHVSVDIYLSCCEAQGDFRIIDHFPAQAPNAPARYTLPPPPLAELQAPAPQWHAEPGASGLPMPEAPRPETLKSAEHVERTERAELMAFADTPIVATDGQGWIRRANFSAAELFGYSVEEMHSLSVHSLLPPHLRERHVMLFQRFLDGDEQLRRMSGRGDIVGYRKDGSFFPLEASIAKFRQDDGWSLVVTLRDISERKQAEAQLLWRATHDDLTRLPNRALFTERLQNALERSRRLDLSVAVLFIDLDGFKLINDSHGHEAGDLLLKEVARRLGSCVRPGDTVARLAGDEFVVLCEQLQQPESISILAERINVALRQPVHLDGITVRVSASIGVAVGHGMTHAAQEILQGADMAMYAAKERGRDGWRFFNEGLQAQARDRMCISQGLPLALARHEMKVVFQPIVDAMQGQVIGSELLLRWHPPAGPVPPDRFIPLAEASGAIVPIGLWVFRQACLAEQRWRGRWGQGAPHVSVNVSARQLDAPGFVAQLQAELAQTGAEPGRMILELTESALMSDMDEIVEKLRALAALGLRIAVDDFGTGYSCLSRLTRLPVSILKIDRSFIANVPDKTEDMAVARAVVGLGKSLGLTLVAEGVETDIQAEEMRKLGCHMLQGYLCGKPVDEADFMRRVDEDARAERPKRLAKAERTGAEQALEAAICCLCLKPVEA
ncbi:EAL domain-containing protein [Roseateles sp. PN1]|uniref:EAL domain-containing protein n=1 Tax=Roseateles sp. PN1 TaxID=3137372 RepID=UPI003139739D